MNGSNIKGKVAKDILRGQRVIDAVSLLGQPSSHLAPVGPDSDAMEIVNDSVTTVSAADTDPTNLLVKCRPDLDQLKTRCLLVLQNAFRKDNDDPAPDLEHSGDYRHEVISVAQGVLAARVVQWLHEVFPTSIQEQKKSIEFLSDALNCVQWAGYGDGNAKFIVVYSTGSHCYVQERWPS